MTHRAAHPSSAQPVWRAHQRGDGPVQKILHFAQIVLLLPFLLISLVPNGVMAVASDDDGLVMVLCTGEGTVEVIVAEDGSLIPVEHDPNAPEETTSCGWAVHSQPFLIADSLPPVTPSALSYRAEFAIVAQHLRRANVLTPSARGPPTPV